MVCGLSLSLAVQEMRRCALQKQLRGGLNSKLIKQNKNRPLCLSFRFMSILSCLLHFRCGDEKVRVLLGELCGGTVGLGLGCGASGGPSLANVTPGRRARQDRRGNAVSDNSFCLHAELRFLKSILLICGMRFVRHSDSFPANMPSLRTPIQSETP